MHALRKSAATLVAVTTIAIGPAAAGDGATDLLTISAPPEMAAQADRLRRLDSRHVDKIADLIGLENPGGPIEVYLIPESAPDSRQVPRWVTGFAVSQADRIVLLPQRLPSYPDSSLADLFRHEVAHIFIARAAGNRPVPRWFNEGLAVIAGSPWGLNDRSRLAVSVLRGGRVSTAALDAEFARGRGDVRRAYSLSAALVRDLLRRHGTDAGARILSRIAEGKSFETAFEEVTGSSLLSAETSFWRRHTFWYRWVPILSSSITLWLGITALALAAGVRRRQRNAEQHRIWEEEERLAESTSADQTFEQEQRPS